MITSGMRMASTTPTQPARVGPLLHCDESAAVAPVGDGSRLIRKDSSNLRTSRLRSHPFGTPADSSATDNPTPATRRLRSHPLETAADSSAGLLVEAGDGDGYLGGH